MNTTLNYDAPSITEVYGLTEERHHELGKQIGKLVYDYMFDHAINMKQLFEGTDALADTPAEAAFVQFTLGCTLTKAAELRRTQMLLALKNKQFKTGGPEAGKAPLIIRPGEA